MIASVAAVLVQACGTLSAGPPGEHARRSAPGGASRGSRGSASARGAIGTPGPLRIEAVAGDGSWVVICQAREDTNGDGRVWVPMEGDDGPGGDALLPYLVRDHGPGEPIGTFIAATRDGRWLIALREGRLAVYDGTTARWTDLPGADLRDDGLALAPHRVADLAVDGTRMTYLRDDRTVVARELVSGDEQVFAVGAGRLWRVEVEPSGRWARVWIVRRDTDRDGALTWPSVRSSLAGRGCRGPAPPYPSAAWRGDEPDLVWLDLERGTFVDAGERVVATAGDLLVSTPADGSLRLGDEQVAAAGCRPEVLVVSASPARVLYTCAPGRGAGDAPVQIAGPGLRATTSARAARRGYQGEAVHVHEGRWCDGEACVDVASGAAVAWQDDAPPVRPRVVGIVLATDNRGRVLVGRPAPAGQLPTGPLRWITARK